MDLKQLQDSAIRAIQLEDTPAFVQGYDRALLDIRSALCFAEGSNPDLDVVLSILEDQNMQRVRRIGSRGSQKK